MRKSYLQPSKEEARGGESSSKREKRNAEADVGKKTEKLERKSTEDINTSADAFIKNFRQQLLIQRLQSIENYEKMLSRGL
ncbi:hypothetical protein RJT34_26828 [Clitoria ternatea]|uniref:Uncharacterized protein n=1 Tax=Clitoria ternatea TaxID=43366 RepID=A0AAN9IG05_CLITE